MEPCSYIFQRNEKEFPDKVAVMTQFLPTFSNETARGEQAEIMYTHDPFDMLEAEIDDETKFSFVFICDRSGSMEGIRIEIVIEALQLFMASLPQNCTFKILSFGTSTESIFGNLVVDYNEKNKSHAV